MMFYTFILIESKNLCTIVTPFDKYKYTRFAMELKPAPDIALSNISKTLAGLDVECYPDDVGIFSIPTTNTWRLSALLSNASKQLVSSSILEMQMGCPSNRLSWAFVDTLQCQIDILQCQIGWSRLIHLSRFYKMSPNFVLFWAQSHTTVLIGRGVLIFSAHWLNSVANKTLNGPMRVLELLQTCKHYWQANFSSHFPFQRSSSNCILLPLPLRWAQSSCKMTDLSPTRARSLILLDGITVSWKQKCWTLFTAWKSVALCPTVRNWLFLLITKPNLLHLEYTKNSPLTHIHGRILPYFLLPCRHQHVFAGCFSRLPRMESLWRGRVWRQQKKPTKEIRKQKKIQSPYMGC